MMNANSKSKNAGFMLSEGIIASSLIITAIVGILALLATSLRNAQFSKEQFIASMLAQEGIEIVRSIRDENFIAEPKRNFDQGGIIYGDSEAAYTDHLLRPFSGRPLKFDPNAGYQYSLGQDTDFIRKINIRRGITDDELIVSVRVDWRVRGVNFNITVEDHLFNWAKS